jgi:hypothetical protein
MLVRKVRMVVEWEGTGAYHGNVRQDESADEQVYDKQAMSRSAKMSLEFRCGVLTCSY